MMRVRVTRTPLALLLAAAGLVLWGGRTAPAAHPRVGVFASHPRVIRYDIERDAFLRHHSVLAPVGSERPGGETAYWGNRLTQFQYLGPPGRGGIYDAMDEYKRHLKLNPRNYRYRR